jgi:mannonate dehydratase
MSVQQDFTGIDDPAFRMTQTMRWFGPADPVSLADIRQSGATEVVTALHEVPNGEVWTGEAIAERRRLIEAAGLGWTVVESLPVSDEIKRGGPLCEQHLEHYRQSLVNLAAGGVSVVTYNFMPLLDWTRTDLAWRMPDGALALRFEIEAIAAFDIHMLGRSGAAQDYAPEVVEGAARRFAAMSQTERTTLERAIIMGLPGSEESFTCEAFRDALATYDGIDADRLRANHVAFLKAVCPIADALGIRLVVHPDDPPFPLFGLPRVVSNAEDLAHLIEQVPNPSNGFCFCCGSFCANRDNDIPAMIERFGSRIGFFHLRNIRHTAPFTFHESPHLDGDVDVVAVMQRIYRLSQAEHRSIPIRPDHGHQMLDDLTKKTNPGYSAIGRLRGLAELRGLEMGIAASWRSAAIGSVWHGDAPVPAE